MSSMADEASFPIAAIEAPPGWIGICPLPGGFGDLQADLAAVFSWQPDTVVTLTERPEMIALGSEDLGRRIEAAGIGWVSLPIRDFGELDSTSAVQWPAVAKGLHRILDKGGKLLLHCRGGLGRSGMIAMRLLVERGETPEIALARIRSKRPGAVETDGQRAWAAAPSTKQ